MNTHRFVVSERFPRLMNPEVCLRVSNQYSQFWLVLSVLWAITRSFGWFLSVLWTTTHRGPEAISMLVDPNVRLRIGHQHSQCWSILARFMDFYSMFRGLGAIFMIDKRYGAFKCRSSTLVVLVNSGPFRGLLLTVLRLRSYFHGS